jgi:hypothetical protein
MKATKMRSIDIMIAVFLGLVTPNPRTHAPQTLKGIVVDAQANPIIACNVIIKGTTYGTVSSDCGEFSIPIDKQEFTLLFHGIAYDDMRTYEIRVKPEDVKDTIVFQLGRWKIKNAVCRKKISKQLKRWVIE